jgi:pyruvate/2-oxoglutarate/acetoin dehydrogenase E1 component
LDEIALLEAATRCRRVVIAHEANRTGGWGAEIAATIGTGAFSALEAPVLRVATPDVRMPAAPALQSALLPSAEAIADAVRSSVRAKPTARQILLQAQ